MSLNEGGMVLAAIGVLIGVILEGWEHWEDFHAKGWKPLVPKVGFGVLAVSLAIEIVFDARLAKESANTRLEAAKIERNVAWRRLTGRQEYTIATALKPFAGERVNFITYFGDLEAWTFFDEIEASLGYGHRAPWVAGWNVHFGRVTWSPRTASGVILEFTPKANDKDREAARALVNVLTAQRVVVLGPVLRGKKMQGETVSGDLDNDAPLVVTVGVHPPPAE